MKLPNGYGSVYKLSGRRRNPWAARKTTGWTYDPEKGKSFPIYKFIGYYSNKRDALQALAEYNKDPYDLQDTMTLQDLYEQWIQDYSPHISQGTLIQIQYTWKICQPLYDMSLRDIKLTHFQQTFDSSGKTLSRLKRVKSTLNSMYDFAVRHEIVSAQKRDIIAYIDLQHAPEGRTVTRAPFAPEEIDLLWKSHTSDVAYILLLIYTGLRIGELLELRKEDVHLEDRYLHVAHSKTVAGIRDVPIAEKIVPIVQIYLDTDGEWFFPTPTGKKYRYVNLITDRWNKTMNHLGMSHTPHDTRHTCVSLLTAAGTDERVIASIVGHKGKTLAESVYTHIDISTKINAINKI